MPAFTKIPAWLRVYNKDICWKVADKERNIYLTFDDGPHPEVTPYILKVLNEHQIKATFFCIGQNVTLYPDIYEKILNGDHAVGNHSFSHRSGWKVPVDEYVSDVNKAKECISSKLFRPPYGRITPLQFKVLKNQYKVIMWDVLSKDYQADLSDEQIIKNATQDLSHGSIIVMHDNDKTMLRMPKILPRIIQELKRNNWGFKTLAE